MQKNTIEGILLGLGCIIWGLLYFCFLKFFPYSLYDIMDITTIRNYSQTELDSLKDMLLLIRNIIEIIAIILIILICGGMIILYKHSKHNIRDGSLVSYSTIITFVGTVAHIVGAHGISWAIIEIAGIIILLNTFKNN